MQQSGIPKFTLGGLTVVAAELVTPLMLKITWSGVFAGNAPFIVPEFDPAIRFPSGAYLDPSGAVPPRVQTVAVVRVKESNGVHNRAIWAFATDVPLIHPAHDVSPQVDQFMIDPGGSGMISPTDITQPGPSQWLLTYADPAPLAAGNAWEIFDDVTAYRNGDVLIIAAQSGIVE